MSVSLSKGQSISLSKAEPGLKKVMVGLGWDTRATAGDSFDLDGSVFLLQENAKVRNDSDFIFYNNLKSVDGSVQHMGDNRSGAGKDDDEIIKVNLETFPRDLNSVVVGVTIHEADQRRQNFGMVRNAYIRVVNEESKKEIARYDLSEDASVETSMIFGELYRHGSEWKFKAVGQGFPGGLGGMASFFGINVG